MIFASLLGGFLLLWLGGEAFVRGSVAIALRLNISQLTIGLTLVGFGTSLPELITSVTAALRGAPALSVGNVVGSNIANVLLILAIAALIRPLSCAPEAFHRDTVALAAATIMGTAFIYFGYIGHLNGLILLAGLVAYIFLVYLQDQTRLSPAGRLLAGKAQVSETVPATMIGAAILVTGGLTAVLGGAWMVVSGATNLALTLGVSKTFIGLTIVAVGTSLPELAVTGIASLRGRSDVALGNVIGSNMFNILGILGITAMVVPINVPPALGAFDLLALLGATALLIVTAMTNRRVSRWEASALLLVYVAFIALRTNIAL
jgi:cation:H+ antiporter